MLALAVSSDHIQNMLNMSKPSVAPSDAHRFIDDFAALLVSWGIPIVAARLYAYLMLSTEPVSLDEIAADLNVSKSGASVGARWLERNMLARRLSEKGSKRVRYVLSDLYAGLLFEHSVLLGNMGRLLECRGPSVATGPAGKRLKDMAKFYFAMRNAIEDSIQELSVPTARDKGR